MTYSNDGLSKVIDFVSADLASMNSDEFETFFAKSPGYKSALELSGEKAQRDFERIEKEARARLRGGKKLTTAVAPK